MSKRCGQADEKPLSNSGTRIADHVDHKPPSLSRYFFLCVLSQCISHLQGKPDCKLFVGGLAGTTTTERLEKHFSQYGTVDFAKVVHNKQGV